MCRKSYHEGPRDLLLTTEPLGFKKSVGSSGKSDDDDNFRRLNLSSRRFIDDFKELGPLRFSTTVSSSISISCIQDSPIQTK